jgi:hypothetical protein
MVGRLMYLLDTNIILEFLLDQDRADEVEKLLRNAPPGGLYISEFALFSLGVILLRRKRPDTFLQAIEDLLVSGEVRLIRLGVGDVQRIVDAAQRFNLDFDDAYQYAAAEKYDLIIVSFDHDFDQTERGRKTPADILP